MLIKNKVIVITGTLSMPRAAVEAAIKKAGGIVKRSVTNETDYLVVGDTGARGITGKLSAAMKKYGVDIVNERALKTALTRAAATKKKRTTTAKSSGKKMTAKKTTGRKKTTGKNTKRSKKNW